MTCEYKTVRLAIAGKTATGGQTGLLAYYDLRADSESEIHALGADGWELVSVLPIEEPSFLGCRGGTRFAIAFFKRQKTG